MLRSDICTVFRAIEHFTNLIGATIVVGKIRCRKKHRTTTCGFVIFSLHSSLDFLLYTDLDSSYDTAQFLLKFRAATLVLCCPCKATVETWNSGLATAIPHFAADVHQLRAVLLERHPGEN
jgi:hypothetical protein